MGPAQRVHTRDCDHSRVSFRQCHGDETDTFGVNSGTPRLNNWLCPVFLHALTQCAHFLSTHEAYFFCVACSKLVWKPRLHCKTFSGKLRCQPAESLFELNKRRGRAPPRSGRTPTAPSLFCQLGTVMPSTCGWHPWRATTGVGIALPLFPVYLLSMPLLRPPSPESKPNRTTSQQAHAPDPGDRSSGGFIAAHHDAARCQRGPSQYNRTRVVARV